LNNLWSFAVSLSEKNDWNATSSAIVEAGASIGPGVRIWHHAHVRAGASVGANCNIGKNAYIGKDVVIGRGCKIQNNVNVYEGVTLGNYVFCGPSMTFTNLSNPLPRSAISRPDKLQSTIVEDGVSIGANAVIVCGHTLGAHSFIAAGSVVIRDVSAFALVAGNPARPLGWVCVCGNRLIVDNQGSAICTMRESIDGVDFRCLRKYSLEDGLLELTEDPHVGNAGYQID